MLRGAQGFAILGAVCLLVFGSGLSCGIRMGDPGSQLTLQIYNKGDRPVRVMLVTAWKQREPTREETWLDVTVEPRGMREANLVLGMGARLGPILAYADGQLVFCQNHGFRPDPESREIWSVEIVENQIACQ